VKTPPFFFRKEAMDWFEKVDCKKPLVKEIKINLKTMSTDGLPLPFKMP
jgi:hypothetical protein